MDKIILVKFEVGRLMSWSFPKVLLWI